MATPLKIAILDCGRPMYKLAMEAGLSESRLSRLSTGLFMSKPAEREILSKLLKVPAERLFPNAEND